MGANQDGGVQRTARALAWLLPTALVLIYIVVQRNVGQEPAIPFLLLFASVVVATGGGMLSGVLAAAAASAFIVQSAATGFGPPTLTGGPIQVLAGCGLHLLTGWFLGQTRDHNRELIEALEESRTGLEESVRHRTAELESLNAELTREIEERESAERALRDSEAMMRHAQRLESVGMLAGGIAHDFNNLLTAIMANTAMARETADAKAQALLDEVAAASSRAADLCRQMLGYAGKQELEVSTVDLGDLVAETVAFVRASVPKKVRFEVTVDASAAVTGDRSQLGQILLNLVTNAAEAIEAVGTVQITVGRVERSAVDLTNYLFTADLRPGPYACIEVTDDGVGMSKEQQERIFDPFFSTKFKGRGLGLPVVFGSVRAHGGTIAVRSEPGRGTTISVLLPLEGNGAPNALPAPQAPRNQNKLRQASGTVLVADDEEHMVRLCRRVLEREGWNVVTASNGKEALERFRQGTDLSLVVLDLTMPELDGHDTIAELRRLDPTIPLVLMSGHSDEASRELPSRSTFLAKPFLPNDLAELTAQMARGDAGGMRVARRRKTPPPPRRS